MRKGYFPGTRFSDDLDFSTDHGLQSETLLGELNEVCRWAEATSGIRFDDIDRNRLADEHQVDRERKVFKFRLYFKDMLGGKDHVDISVRVDVTEYDRLALPAQERQLIHPYSDADALAATIRCVKLEEALADKLKCLLQRRYCYDIFDVVYGAFISRDIEIDRSEMMRVFLRKTIFGPSPLAAKQLLLDLPWSCSGATGARCSSQQRAAFYPSRLRNPIMQAAADRKLLKITYHNATRLMEPYALTFKRRKSDGVGHEYFYAYDRTGGNSGPGIKTMFAHDVQALEVTDIDFEPRFEIQLAKAGDSSQSGYFTGTPGPRGRSVGRPASRPRRTRSSSRGLTYIIECPYCTKEFRRTTSSTRLNKHKDRYGNQCYGRAGVMVRYGY